MKQIKVPTPRKLPSGSWFLQVCVKGKRISVTEDTEQACIARAVALKQELLQPVSRKTEPTLSTCIDHYIEGRQNVISPATIRGYRSIQRNRFQSVMDRPISSLDEKGWQRMVNLEARQVSAKTVKNSWDLISSAIEAETGRHYSVRLPQVIPNEREWLEPEELDIFMEAVKGDMCEVAALLALHSLRRSELYALTWDNIDLAAGVLKISGAVVQSEEGMVWKPESKNRTSHRQVPIMIPRLRELLERADHTTPRVVTIAPTTVLRHIRAICVCSDIPAVNLHGLRHTFASLAYHLHVPEKVAMQIGGWANDQTMRKIYTHVAQADILKSQNDFAAYFQKY